MSFPAEWPIARFRSIPFYPIAFQRDRGRPRARSSHRAKEISRSIQIWRQHREHAYGSLILQKPNSSRPTSIRPAGGGGCRLHFRRRGRASERNAVADCGTRRIFTTSIKVHHNDACNVYLRRDIIAETLHRREGVRERQVLRQVFHRDCLGLPRNSSSIWMEEVTRS